MRARCECGRRPLRRVAALAACIAVGVLATPAAAQDSQSAGNDGDGGEEAAPTFQEVMQNPGDLELSFRYARKQIRQGNLTGAATTLDRILLLQPSLQDVRLMYGIVLYRLGDLSSAESELDRVSADALPANLQAELERYRERVAEAQRKTTVNASISTGFAHETNPTGAPDGGDVVVLDIPLDVRDSEDDLSGCSTAAARSGTSSIPSCRSPCSGRASPRSASSSTRTARTWRTARCAGAPTSARCGSTSPRP